MAIETSPMILSASLQAWYMRSISSRLTASSALSSIMFDCSIQSRKPLRIERKYTLTRNTNRVSRCVKVGQQFRHDEILRVIDHQVHDGFGHEIPRCFRYNFHVGIHQVADRFNLKITNRIIENRENSEEYINYTWRSN